MVELDPRRPGAHLAFWQGFSQLGELDRGPRLNLELARFMASSDPAHPSGAATREEGEDSSKLRYRLRSDLAIVKATASEGEDHDVRVIDPFSGKEHVLTADEFRICQAATKADTFAQIREAFLAETGREISHGALFTFFRRLRGLGLLQDRRRQRLEEGPPGSVSSGRTTQEDDSLLIVGPSSDANTSDVGEADSQAPEQRQQSKPRAERDEVRAAPAELGGQQVFHSAPVEDSPAQKRRLMHSRRRRQKQGSSESLTQSAVSVSPTLEGAAAGNAEQKTADQVTGNELRTRLGRSTQRTAGRRRRSGPKQIDPASDAAVSASPIASATQDPIAALNLTGAEEFEADAGGGLRAFLRAQGRGGGPGAMHDLFAGFGQRARAERPNAEGEEASGTAQSTQVPIFNPNALLDFLSRLLWPLKFVFVPLLLLGGATIVVAYQQRELLTKDIKSFDPSIAVSVLLGLIIVNLGSRLTQAAVIQGFGGSVRDFGIRLSFGIPRFYVDLSAIPDLGRRAQLWCHAAPLLARLGLFCTGILLWLSLRDSVPFVANLALVEGQIALFAFLVSLFPLLLSDGHRWLVTYLGAPDLGASALRATTDEIDDGDEDADAASSPWAATFYVLASALAISLLALVGQAYFDVAHTGNIQLLTAALLLGVCIGVGIWIGALWKYAPPVDSALNPSAAHRLLIGWTGHADIVRNEPISISGIAKVLWGSLVCLLFAAAFLPYRYEAGGKFEIVPADRFVVSARTSGELKQVLVHDGDWVKANQIVAKLSSEDQERAVSITGAELQRARAQLAQLGGGQQSSVDSALDQSISDAFSDTPESGGQNSTQSGSGYSKVQALRAARAEVERLTRKLAFERDQLRDTDVRAPREGRVTTPDAQLSPGIWIRRGGRLLLLDDTRTLEAEVNIPEADAAMVRVGDSSRLRAWSQDDHEIAGTVISITPVAQPTPYGMVVRAKVSVPNPDNFMRPGMTGHAKIEGQEMRVWEAFLGRFIRFVRVEMWSWVP